MAGDALSRRYVHARVGSVWREQVESGTMSSLPREQPESRTRTRGCRAPAAYCLCILGALFAAGCEQGSGAGEPPAKAARPHIVLIVADDLGLRDVGYNGGAFATPNIDRLASQGVRLSTFYTQPLCSPARAALLTGRYPIRYGVNARNFHPWSRSGLPQSERTLAEALKEAGYRTALCGKWHLGYVREAYLPQNRGFDHQYGLYLGTVDYWEHTHARFGGRDWHRNGRDVREEGYATDLIAAEAARVIHEHASDQPLFLYVPFTAVHGPYQAPPQILERYAHIENEELRAYAAMVSSLDTGVGTILSALERRGIEDDTIVVFCSDNGSAFERGGRESSLRGSKGSVYEGGIRVPAVVRWPGRLPAGTRCDEWVHMVDWFPTLVRLGGGSPDSRSPLDGRDILDTLAGRSPSPHDQLLLSLGSTEGALRRGKWKLVAYFQRGGAVHELYDLSSDPRETTDLSGKYPERAQRMLRELKAYLKQAEPRAPNQQQIPGSFRPMDIWGPWKPQAPTP